MPRPVTANATYVPGIDGVRAIAVIAVLGYHLAITRFTGGLLGVGVFFTLSGFLITRILVSSWTRTGTFELRRFWLHRARRLLPAVGLVLLTVMASTLITARNLLGVRWGETWSAAVYVANWHDVAHQKSYFDRFAGPGPLDHLWSLSVEEQFYVVWPILLLLGFAVFKLGRRALATITLALAAGSFLLLAVLAHPGFDNTRAYEGTDTRAGGLLVGALLAFAWPRIATVVAERAFLRAGIDLLGVVGLAGIVLLIAHTNDYSLSLYSHGLLLLSLATVALVAAVATPGSILGAVLGVQPLRWIGERSYGIYLWQLPVTAAVLPASHHDHVVAWDIAVTASTLILAELSWRFVEDPIRRRGFVGALASARPHLVRERDGSYASKLRPSLLPLAVIAMVVVGTLTLASWHSVAPSQAALSSGVDTDDPPLPPDVDQMRHHHEHDGPTTGNGDDNGSTSTPGEGSAKPETSCTSVAYIGESTSLGLMDPNYLPEASERLPAQMKRVGVTVLKTDILGARSTVERYHDQPNAQDAVDTLLGQGFDGCWVIAMGTNDAANQAVGGVYPYPERVALLMDKLKGMPVMWLTVKSLLSSGPYEDANMLSYDNALQDACTTYANLRIYDWRSEVQNQWFISDGIHFTSAGYAQRAERIADALAMAYPADGTPSATCDVSSGLK